MSKTLNEMSGKFYMGKNLKNSEEYDINYQIQKNKEEKELEELGKILLNAEKEKQKEINEKLKTLEILPMGKKIIISAYPRNPYRKVVEGNIIVDYDGSFMNPDSGEKDKLKEFVGCAKVIEVGPECEWLNIGDDVYYDTRSTYPVPFMSMGYLLTTEPQILCVINEKLKERFKM